MLLAVDIGNSSITMGGFREEAEPVFTLRFGAGEQRSADEYVHTLRQALQQQEIEAEEISDGAIASVVPALTHTLVRALELLGCQRVLTVGTGVKTGFSVRTDAPGEVGADIIANAAATVRRAEGAAIMVDIGTATTVFALNEKKELLGGAILPGIRSSLEGLRASTAQLPMVALEPSAKAIGKNTADCISNGVLLGHAFGIDGLIDRFAAEMGVDAPEVFVTGGPASLVVPHCRHTMRQEPFLTLKGLRVIYELTRKKKII